MRGAATKAALLGTALLLAQPATAIGSSVVIAAGYNPSLPAARIQTRADYVAVPINVHSDAKDAVKDSEVVVFINYRTKIHLSGGTSR